MNRIWAALALISISSCTPVDPCAKLDCGRGTCVITASAPACLCDRGFEAIDNRCFPITFCGAQRPDSDGGCTDLPRWDCSPNTASTAADPAEPNDCPAQARTLSIGGSVIGAFGVRDDLDWYFIPGAPNSVVKLIASGSNLSVTTFDADGFSASSPLDLTLPFSVGARGLFLVARGQQAGPYHLALELIGEDDFSNDTFGTTQAASEAHVQGVIDFSGDVDVVQLRLAPQSSAELSVSSGDTVVDLLGENGRFLASTTTNLRVWRDDAPLFIAVRAAATLPWAVDLTPLGPDDGPDHPAFAKLAGSNRSQIFERSGDLDLFRIEPIASHVYEAQCLERFCELDLLDRAGVPIVSDSNLLRFRTPMQSPVFLSFSSFVAGPWEWRLTDLGFDDHGDTFESATWVPYGGSMHGTLEFAEDVDAFVLQYPIGTVLRLMAPPNKELSGNGWPLAEHLVVDRTDLLVRVSGAVGRYDITVIDEGLEPGGSGSAPVPVVVPFSTDGGIDFPGDLDVFSFNAVVGHVYRAMVVPSGLVTLHDATRFRSANGQSETFLVSAATGPMECTVSAVTGGRYHLTISDVGIDDQPDTRAEPLAPLTPGVPVTGRFDWQDDLDLFDFETVSGRFYEERCNTTGCVIVGTASPSLCFQAGSLVPPPYLGVRSSYESTGFAQRPWSFELLDLGVDDQTQPMPVSFGSTTSTQLTCRADTDVFSWTAAPRQLTTLHASCDGCQVQVNTPNRGGMQTRAVDGGLTLLLPPSTLPHVAEFSGERPTTVSFSVTDGGFDDHGDTLVSATLVNSSVALRGSFEFERDVDVLAWDLTAGGHLFELIGTDVSAQLWDSSGYTTTLSTSSLQFIAPTAGRYFLLLRGTGEYEVVVQ